MTICIAIKTIEGHIVGFTDRLILDSYINKAIDLPPFSKIYKLNEWTVLMIAGHFNICGEIIDRYKELLPPITEFKKEHIYLLSKAILEIKNLQKEAFHEKDKFEFKSLSMIIAGIDSKGFIYHIDQSGAITSYTNSSYLAVGSGGAIVDYHLHDTKLYNQMSLEKACYEGYKAKRLSEQDINVGKATDMFIIRNPVTVNSNDFTNNYIPILEEIYTLEKQKINNVYEEINKLLLTKKF